MSIFRSFFLKKKIRHLSSQDSKKLAPGSENYASYVGPPRQYDFMGASQFRLLCTLGLRDDHKLLDFGCGSLRAGRLFIPYLNPGNFYGLEPNRWLIQDAIKNQIGKDICKIKKPNFLHHTDFSCEKFEQSFDYILAQSIFSHAGQDIILKSLHSFKRCLSNHGLIVATFIQTDEKNNDFDGNGWVYPGCVQYTRDKINTLIEKSDLVGVEIPWYHPRQTWYALGHHLSSIPTADDFRYLQGKVLFDSELSS